MGKINNLKGQRFGRLLVIGDSGKKASRYVAWTCLCDCGNFTIVQSGHLKSGHTSSCGCLQKDRAGETHFKHGDKRGGINGETRLHRIWRAMKRRCNNKNDNRFKNYGGRGITVCSEWEEYLPFKEWAFNNGYADDLTIDRIDNDGDYCPENCQWITMSENSRKGSKKQNM